MKLHAFTVVFSIMFIACAGNNTNNIITQNILQKPDTVIVEDQQFVTLILPLDSIFNAIDSIYTHQTFVLPNGYTATVLFSEGNPVLKNDGSTHPAKGNHDMLAFIPNNLNPNKGWLFVSHETKYKDSNLGDGGGATIFEIEKSLTGNWEVISDFHHIDFSTVRGTDRNCGGSVGPNGMIYSCEESAPKTNKAAFQEGKGHTDTSDVGSLKYHENIGWIVEIDPKTKKATQKIIAMGRYFHEDIEFMEDNVTVYLTDDYEPGVFFKFVADKPLDYTHGQLYAYKQNKSGASGEWLALARDTATMLRARDAAIDLGATMFVRHEWMARFGNKIYIAETGHDQSDWTHRFAQGGVAANHIEKNHLYDKNIMKDVYGRILVFDTQTNEMKVHIEGGISDDGKTIFSNPDCITPVHIAGKNYLVIHEDLNWYDKNRLPLHIEKRKQFVNELFFLDLTIERPSVNDLKRFAVAPLGAELTGGIFSPDGGTLFINVMHPNAKNKAPYNKSVTVAITGFNKND